MKVRAGLNNFRWRAYYVITAVERSSETTGDLTSSGNFNCWRKKSVQCRGEDDPGRNEQWTARMGCTCELHL